MSRLGLINKLKTRFGETPADSDTAATNIGGDIYDETTDVTKLSDADGDTYIEVEESADDDHARIYTAGSERVTVDDSGNVGIGTTSPGDILHIQSSGAYIQAQVENTQANGNAWFSAKNDAREWEFGVQGTNSDSFTIYDRTAAIGRFFIDSSGNVGIGETNPPQRLSVKDNVNGYVVQIQNDGNNQNRYGLIIQAGADDGSGQTYYIHCRDGDGNAIGYIENNSGTFQLVDVSDERLKTEIEPTKINGIEIINKIEIDEFYKQGSREEKIKAGFVAQKLKKVYPEAVSEYHNKDEIYYGISKQELIAPIIKCIQEQNEKIKEFEKRLKKLEEKDEK